MSEITLEWHYDPGWDDQIAIARYGDRQFRADLSPEGWAYIKFPFDEERHSQSILDTRAERYMTQARATRCMAEERFGAA